MPQGDSLYYGVGGESGEDTKIQGMNEKLDKVMSNVEELEKVEEFLVRVEELTKKRGNFEDTGEARVSKNSNKR